MISDVAKNTIKIFHPLQDLDEAVDEVVLEWLDGRLSKIEDIYIDLLKALNEYRREILSRSKRR